MDEERFGHYRIEALLGRGGMGVVYRAFDESHKRYVALKVLAPHLVVDEAFRSRFRRESELAARLREAHVIPIHNYGEIEGRLYIDMRLVEGSDLASVLEEKGALPPKRAVGIIEQVAWALDAAHADGLIHRDVKPSNILVCDGEQGGSADFVYLVDFGIARAVEDDGQRLTKTGSALGSLDYMAPERFLEHPIDRRSDIYSLGCLLYECLTGRRPFSGDGLPALMHKHLNTVPPRPSETVPDLPTAIDEVISKGMAKEPSRRFARAGELAVAAREALRPLPGAGSAPINEVAVRGGPTKLFTVLGDGASLQTRPAGIGVPIPHTGERSLLGSYVPAYGPPIAKPANGPPHQVSPASPVQRSAQSHGAGSRRGTGPASSMKSITIADCLVVGGGFLFFVFSFLPWISASSDLCDGLAGEIADELECGSLSASAWTFSGFLGLATVLVVLAAAGTTMRTLGVLPERRPLHYLSAGLGLMAMICFLIGVVDILTTEDALGVNVGPTFGLGLGLLAISIFSAGVVMSFRAASRTSSRAAANQNAAD